MTGARPDTAFARDVFAAGSLGILQLSSGEILPGSENVMLEIRDRRNPEVVISRETLTRGVDYNLDPVTGQIFFLRYISTFDHLLNLTQIVVTYEHRANSMNSAVYTARAHKNFKSIGLKLGLSAVMQTQSNEGNFFLAGFDAEKKLPGKGLLQMAWAMSNGEVVGTGNVFNSDGRIDAQRQCLSGHVAAAAAVRERRGARPLPERVGRILQSFRRHGHARLTARRSESGNEAAGQLALAAWIYQRRQQD